MNASTCSRSILPANLRRRLLAEESVQAPHRCGVDRKGRGAHTPSSQCRRHDASSVGRSEVAVSWAPSADLEGNARALCISGPETG